MSDVSGDALILRVVANTVLITSVTGIAVSGVVGPAATSWAARRAARKQFLRDQAAKRRDDLGALLDEAASVLGVGPIRLRETWEAAATGAIPDALRAWPDEVYILGQRLRLRLGAQDPVVTRYETVRTALVDAGWVAPDAEAALHDTAIEHFEVARDQFLAAAQAKLDAPISDKEAP